MHDHFINMILATIPHESISVTRKKQASRETCSLKLLNMKIQVWRRKGVDWARLNFDGWLGRCGDAATQEELSQWHSRHGKNRDHHKLPCFFICSSHPRTL